MELPKTGSIVIIDDKINEALPLINTLSAEGVSICYFDGKRENYPQKPLDNIRMIFLDMHLDEVASASSVPKNIISTLMTGLNKVVSPESGPYAILVWSKHDSQHIQDFIDSIMGENGLQNKPISVLNMEKSECFERSYYDNENEVAATSETGYVNWKLKENGLNIIKSKMQEQLKLVDAFEVFYNWENGIRESAKETIQSINLLFENNSEEWNKNIKFYFIKLAKAYAGKTLGDTSNDILRNVYYTLNDIASDRNCVVLEKKVKKVGNIEINESISTIKGRVEICKNHNGKMYYLTTDNNKWYLYEEQREICSNKKLDKIFEYKNGSVDCVVSNIAEIYWRNIAKLNSLLLMRSYVLSDYRPGNVYISSENTKNELSNELKFTITQRVNSFGIELEMSPLCDYSQKKRRRVRVLPGLLVPYEYKIDDKPKYLYVSPPVWIDNEIRKMVFDFRYYTSEKTEYLKNKDVKYAISDLLLQVIKEEFSSHGTRSGVVYME